MSISSELIENFPERISTIRVEKSDLHGEDATEVTVNLIDGRTLTGTFAKHPRSGFGGIQFSGPKDIVALMTAKIQSVLEGSYERS